MTGSPRHDIERVTGRLLVWLTYVSVILLVIGVILMLAQGISPLDVPPSFDPAAIAADVGAMRATAFLWLGLLAVLVTPILRVVVAGIGFALDREWVMALVAVGILVVIAVGVTGAFLTEV